MFKVTLKGILAHKLRFLLTGVAVILGVAFISGTLVLTDTIKKTFDGLFASVYDGTDAVRAQRERGQGPVRARPARPHPRDARARRCRRVHGAAAAEGQVQIQRAQFLDRKGKGIGDPGQGAPTLGFNWNTVRRLNPFTLDVVPGEPSRPPTAAGRGRDGPRHREGRALRDRRHGHRSASTTPRSPRTGSGSSASRSSATPTGPPARPSRCSRSPEAQRRQRHAGPARRDRGRGQARASSQDAAGRVRSSRRSIDHGVEVITGAKLIKEQQNQIEQGLGFFTTFLLIFAIIALFVGSFIIVNTFSIVVAQRTREMALLRALGASGRQVRGSVLGEALLVGLRRVGRRGRRWASASRSGCAR